MKRKDLPEKPRKMEPKSPQNIPEFSRQARSGRPCPTNWTFMPANGYNGHFHFQGANMRRALRFLAVVLVLAAAIAALAQKRSITEKDIFQFNWIGDPQISPDGSRVAFVKVSVSDKKDGYDTAIWSVALDGSGTPRRMTDGTRDSSPRWSPDGQWLVFVRSPESPGVGA